MNNPEKKTKSKEPKSKNPKSKKIKKEILAKNKIIGYGTTYGTIIDPESIDKYDDIEYVQIELIGNHANETKTGNIMLVSYSDINIVMMFDWYLNSGGYPSTYGSIDGEIKYGNIKLL